jgi:hypothetical protein
MLSDLYIRNQQASFRKGERTDHDGAYKGMIMGRDWEGLSWLNV